MSAPLPKTILITGATGAIGSALALAYAAPGCMLVLHGRNAARLREVAQACEARGARTETMALDLQEVNRLIAWLEEVGLRHAVDLAIVNAATIGVLRPDGNGETWQDVQRIADVNVRAALATVTALLPYMMRRGSGQIAVMSSLVAYFGLPVAPAYSASRAAVKIYGEALREPLARRGIRVSVVLPGFVKSDMSDQLPVPKLFMMSAEVAARRIQRGLAKNRARISFPFPLNLACWFLSVLPPALSQRMLALLGFKGK
jgi:short-subunit dehydrogenase